MQFNTIDNTGISDYHSGTPVDGESVSANTLLTIQELCELLRVKRSYIYWLTNQKKIPYIKMQGHLRFRQSEIDDWLASQEVVRNASLQKEIQNKR